MTTVHVQFGMMIHNLKTLLLGQGSESIDKTTKNRAVYILLGLGLLLLLGNRLNWFAGNKAQRAALKAVEKYESLSENSNRITICVQAAEVVSAYLHAKDDVKHAEWEAIKQKDCKEAGVPYY